MKSTFLRIIIFICFVQISYSQTKTAYQKRVHQITISFINELGLPSLAKSYNESGDFGKLKAMSEFSRRLNTEKGTLAYFKYMDELQKAQKLKTPEEIKKDKLKKEKELALEDEKIKQRKLEEKRREGQIKFENSDYFKIKTKIKNQFEEWLKKGEFEKVEAHKQRIESKAEIGFDSICYKVINELIYNRKWDLKPMLKFDEYNSEGEYFNFKIQMYDKIISDSIKVDIKKAQDFKYNAQLSELSNEISDWCIIDNELYPLKIELKNDDKSVKIVRNNIENKKLLNFSTMDFGIDREEAFIKNIIFDSFRAKDYLKNEEIKLKEKESRNKEQEVYSSNGVEVDAEFLGGIRKFNSDISKLDCLEVKNEGGGATNRKIVFEFIIEIDGVINEVKVLKSSGNTSVDNCAVNFLKNSQWNSGLMNGKKVRVKKILPVNW